MKNRRRLANVFAALVGLIVWYLIIQPFLPRMLQLWDASGLWVVGGLFVAWIISLFNNEPAQPVVARPLPGRAYAYIAALAVIGLYLTALTLLPPKLQVFNSETHPGLANLSWWAGLALWAFATFKGIRAYQRSDAV